MRIIAGERRGQRFDGPKGNATRPTTDLVRESLFNILGDIVDGLLVVDLFAGTGALGLEALSRGAERAIFVEKNRENAALIRRNLATLRFEDRATVLVADAYKWGGGFEPDDGAPFVAFLDPPYSDYESHPAKVNQLLVRLVETMSPGSALAVESSGWLDAEILPDLPSWDLRKYGGTQVAIRYRPREEDVEDSTVSLPASDGPLE
ncbi:16S rRNA (guanine(966)-N(2))-methyltransferase RsmD [Singulisphaera rosea]